MLKLSMRAFAAWNLHETGLFEVGAQLANFARHGLRFSYSKLPANAGLRPVLAGDMRIVAIPQKIFKNLLHAKSSVV